MGQEFILGDETLWDPSNGAARVFLHQLAYFEEELGLPSGFGPMVADECRVDPDVFAVFADEVVSWHWRRHHTIIRAHTEGFVATLVALARRAGVEVRWAQDPCGVPHDSPDPYTRAAAENDAWAHGIRARAAELDRAMGA
ncbi:DUF6086 family protein [Streptomyces sp. CAU 1734]|uniref:DUF6086 family protein n=1 Tax=Streptomyces sp. CAU 1734 TaxID=3140360 RepID=UPI003261BE64